MKIYCLEAFTGVSDYCGLPCNRIVSSKRAIEDYLKFTKERIVSILSRKPYLRNYPVYVSVRMKMPNFEGVYSTVSSYTIVLQINSDNSFKRTLKTNML